MRDMETSGDTIPVATSDLYPTAFVPAWTNSKATAAEAEANARLIATAPDLYAALQFARDIINPHFNAVHARAVERADAALAKARGEQA